MIRMKTAFLDILFFVTLQFLSRYCVDLTMLVQDGAIFLSSISPWDSGSQTGFELWVGEREWDWWSECGRLPVPWWLRMRENRRMIVLFSLQRNCCCKQSKQREDIKHSDIPATPLDSWSCDSEDNLIQPLSSKAGSNLNMNFHRICPFIPVAAFSMWLSSHWPPKR